MKPHMLQLDLLLDWMEHNEYIYASSTADHKKLIMTSYGAFKVTHHDKLVWQGILPATAVEVYNSINSVNEVCIEHC